MAADYLVLAVDQLTVRRVALLEEVARVDRALAALSEVSEPHASFLPDVSRPVPGAAQGRYAGVGLKDAVRMLLAESDSVTVPEIVKALREGGFQSKSPNLNPNTHTTLRRLIDAGEAEKLEGGAYRAVR